MIKIYVYIGRNSQTTINLWFYSLNKALRIDHSGFIYEMTSTRLDRHGTVYKSIQYETE